MPLKALRNAAGERFLSVGKNVQGVKLYDRDVVELAQQAAASAAQSGGKSGRK